MPSSARTPAAMHFWLLFAVFAESGSAHAIESPLSLADFFSAQESVTVQSNGSRATMAESSVISVVSLENDPSLQDRILLVPQADSEFHFDYQFEEATGENDQFVAVLFDTARGPVDGELSIIELNSSATGTGQFVLSNRNVSGLGVIFQLHELNPAAGSATSSVTLSNLRLVTGVDTDGDGVPDSEDNCIGIKNVGQLNTDGDTQGNACDSDDDNDGLSDGDELNLHATNPLLIDTDADGYTDKEEIDAGSNPLDAREQPAANTLNLWLIKAAMDRKAD
jgi:hypothetical protein